MNTQLKLKFYYEHVLGQVYSEGDSPFHKNITQDVIKRFIDPLKLAKNSVILDLGCGPGYFLEEMKSREYTDVTGITMSREDVLTCQDRQLSVKTGDINFLTQRDESVDLLFCRHALEHSPFPYFSLLEYNRVLKPNAYLYVEVPAPDCDRQHEDNRNHYSIMGKTMWLQLLKRAGFNVNWHEYEFPVKDNDDNVFQERYYVFVCQRRRPVDVK